MSHLMKGFNESEYLCSDYRCSNFSSQSTEKEKISTSGHPGRQRSCCLRSPWLLNNVIMTSPVFFTIIKVFANLINLTESKGGNFMYPMMHPFTLYYQASERTWSYQFNRDATVEQRWKATSFADKTFCTFAVSIYLRFSFYYSKYISC